MSTCKLLRRKSASDYLRDTYGIERAPSTLAKLAVTGGGPIFRRAGRIPLYSTSDLDAWAISILSKPIRRTSEVRLAGRISMSDVTNKSVETNNERA